MNCMITVNQSNTRMLASTSANDSNTKKVRRHADKMINGGATEAPEVGRDSHRK